MTEQDFWQIIELSWADSPELNQIRAEALQNNDEELLEKLEEGLGDQILENYTNRLLTLDKEAVSVVNNLLPYLSMTQHQIRRRIS